MKRHVSLVVAGLASAFFLASAAIQAKSDVGVREETLNLNPFECYGRYQASAKDRTRKQLKLELRKKLSQLDENEHPEIRAMKQCVIAKLKARLGKPSAKKHFEKAIELDPTEPGYELWYGEYWSGARGARRPVRSKAEKHFGRALQKLEVLRERGEARDYHDVVEDWTQKHLVVLNQSQGQPLTPVKAHPHDGRAVELPSASVQSQTQVSRDTQDFFHNSPMRMFTGEKLFAESDLRAARPLNDRENWDLARAPLRYQLDNSVRLVQRSVGAVDLFHSYHRANDLQILSFYEPNREFADVTVSKFGVGYEGVFPLYPLFDARLQASFQRIDRRGVIEFLPDREEQFNAVELKPSFSRFLGPNKLTLDLVYVYMDITDLPGIVPEQAMREKVIRGFKVDYAIYTPMILPYFRGGLHTQRTDTRGLHLYGGAAQDDEVYGTHRVVRQDFYAGTNFFGPARWDFNLQGTYYRGATRYVDPNDPTPEELDDPGQSFSHVAASGYVRHRFISYDTRPGRSAKRALGFVVNDMALVMPITYETAVEGPNTFSNVRAGAELWTTFLNYAIGGTGVLTTVAYHGQYFPDLGKFENLMSASIRVGWGDL